LRSWSNSRPKRKGPILDVKNLAKVDEFERFLDSLPSMSHPLSVLSFVKASKQAFYNGNPSKYSLPTRQEGAVYIEIHERPNG
jgi:hypothetical protein